MFIKRHIRSFWIIGSFSFCCLNVCFPARGNPIEADSTLPIPSAIACSGTVCTINQGTTIGNNLFHSFTNFSVLTNNTAYFNNDPAIANIISRVTGASISNIDGLLKANGSANLFLINPKGVVFGSNAKLDIGGSLVASTASSIKFQDGIFSATNPQAPPLLTVNVPIGLQLDNPGAIALQQANLAVLPGKTLALVGGEIAIAGGQLTASGGRIDLGSVGSGLVSLNPIADGYALGYAGIVNFQDIHLSQGATVNTSGIGGGDIQTQSRQLTLTEGSRLLGLTFGGQSGGKIAVNTSESVEITGTGNYDDNVVRFVTGTAGPDNLRNGFFTVSFGTGAAGDITINTPKFTARDGSFVSTTTFGPGRGGNLTVNAADSVNLSASFLATGTGPGKNGDSGTLIINTKNFTASNKSVAVTASIGAGRGGDLTLNASDSVELIGSSPIVLPSGAKVFTALLSSTLGSGDAGNLQVNTARLALRDGAGIAASTYGAGQGGNITVKATDSVKLSGRSPDGKLLSAIAPVTEPGSTGQGGNLTIQTDKLVLQDGGRASVRSRGTGSAGNLDVTANSIKLQNEGGFEGTTESGEGGNITLRSHNLQILDKSFISATAGAQSGAGNGGNITIDTDTIVLLNKSEITANAFQGRGGNIQINTQGLFRTLDSAIAASSEFGVTGVVEVRILNDSNVQNAISPLASNFVSSDRILASSCFVRRNIERGSLTLTGTGGLPNIPYGSVRSRFNITQVQAIGKDKTPNNRMPASTTGLTPIQEAKGIFVTTDGRTILATASQLMALTPTDRRANAKDLICYKN